MLFAYRISMIIHAADAFSSADSGTSRPENAAARMDWRSASARFRLAATWASVSIPLCWDEVEQGTLRPGDFTLRTVPERVERLADVFAPLLQAID